MKQFTSICRAMGSYSDACLYSLFQNPSVVIHEATNFLFHKPCEATKLCPEGSTMKVSESVGQISSEKWENSKEKMCSLCPAVMENVHGMVKGRKNEDKLIDWSIDVCTSLSYSKKSCSKFVNEYHKMIYSYFKTNATYDYICTKGLGLCDRDSTSGPIWPLFPAGESSSEMTKKLSRVSFDGDSTKVKVLKPEKPHNFKISFGDPLPSPFKPLPINRIASANGGDCQACTDMFSTISQYMTIHPEYVDSTLNSTCDGLKDSKSCIDFIKQYGYLFKNSGHIVPEKVIPSWSEKFLIISIRYHNVIFFIVFSGLSVLGAALRRKYFPRDFPNRNKFGRKL